MSESQVHKYTYNLIICCMNTTSCMMTYRCKLEYGTYRYGTWIFRAKKNGTRLNFGNFFLLRFILRSIVWCPSRIKNPFYRYQITYYTVIYIKIKFLSMSPGNMVIQGKALVKMISAALALARAEPKALEGALIGLAKGHAGKGRHYSALWYFFLVEFYLPDIYLFKINLVYRCYIFSIWHCWRSSTLDLGQSPWFRIWQRRKTKLGYTIQCFAKNYHTSGHWRREKTVGWKIKEYNYLWHHACIYFSTS